MASQPKTAFVLKTPEERETDGNNRAKYRKGTSSRKRYLRHPDYTSAGPGGPGNVGYGGLDPELFKDAYGSQSEDEAPSPREKNHKTESAQTQGGLRQWLPAFLRPRQEAIADPEKGSLSDDDEKTVTGGGGERKEAQPGRAPSQARSGGTTIKVRTHTFRYPHHSEKSLGHSESVFHARSRRS